MVRRRFARPWRLLPGAIVVASALVALGWQPAGAREGPAAPTLGRQIWLRDCATCHGPSGEGTRRGVDITESGTAAVDFMVRTGRMPLSHPDEPMRRHPVGYTQGQIRALVDYTATFVHGPAAGTPDLSGADLSAGAEQYLASCAACHQSAGSGGTLAYGDQAPPLGSATAREVAEAIRIGPGNMPNFSRDTMSDQEVADVTRYVEHLRKHPGDRGGFALGHVGPVPEGLVAWTIGLGALVLVARWLGSVQADDVDPDDA